MKRLLSLLQRELGLSKSEAIVLLTIVTILLGGWVGKLLVPTHTTHDVLATQKVIALLDSMQRAMNENARDASTAQQHRSVDEAVSLTTEPPSTSRHAVARTASKQAPLGKVRINTASRAMLMRLPRVGPAMAEKIIAERERRPFTSVEDLTRVKGIGPKTIEKLRNMVSVP
ncbi:MAG: ComEA family DNA-binding protein [Bradyrhizobiaceae bacterium]|nr:ComEA family DNA-binding protein [Bradyrhizobiaceae bacterium]